MENLYNYKRFAILYVDDEEKSLANFSRAFGDQFHIFTAPSAQLYVAWAFAAVQRRGLELNKRGANVVAPALLAFVLFFTALWRIATAWLIGALFIVCMVCLIGSLIVFIHDVNRSLSALKLELKEDGGA
jgi:hypothetical protein